MSSFCKYLRLAGSTKPESFGITAADIKQSLPVCQPTDENQSYQLIHCSFPGSSIDSWKKRCHIFSGPINPNTYHTNHTYCAWHTQLVFTFSLLVLISLSGICAPPKKEDRYMSKSRSVMDNMGYNHTNRLHTSNNILYARVSKPYFQYEYI